MLECRAGRGYTFFMKRLAAIVLITIAIGLGDGPVNDLQAQAAGRLAVFDKGTVSIVSDDQSHKFRVDLALTHHQQMQGLMFRRNMPADAGMLFVYKQEAPSRDVDEEHLSAARHAFYCAWRDDPENRGADRSPVGGNDCVR